MENKFDYSSANLASFNKMINKYGWVVYENALDEGFVDEINESLNDAYNVRRKIQIANGIGDNMNGTLHHLVERDTFTLKFLKQKYCAE